MAFKTAKAKRSLTYSTVILLVISTFLLTYLYYFIPVNRKTIHKNGFLILQTIARNIEEVADARMSLATNFYKNAASIDSAQDVPARKKRKAIIDTLLKENNIDATVNISAGPFLPTVKDSTGIRIEDGMLVVSIFNTAQQEKVEFFEPIDPLLGSILSIQKSELFRSYLLGKMNGVRTELLYHDKELAIRSDRGIDSLLPKGEVAFLTGIRELRLHDVSQKVFYYPFRIQDFQLIIGGFVESEEYNTALRKIPFYFIYPLAIIFLLLLVSLPIIKFYVMDSNERVRMKDIIMFGLSVFTGASLVTLMVIHFCLWKGEEQRVKQNLEILSGEIERSFNREFQQAYKQLSSLDSFKNARPPEKADYSNPVRQFIKDLSGDPSRYFNFDRVSWIDPSGEQRVKADLYSQPVFTNVSKRHYFQVYKNGAPYSLPGDPGKRMGWEPIYSRTNGDFNITISRKDTAAGGYIVALAINANSVVQTILPAGYGFCIIDEQGNVQVHADKNRNLNENFFRKIAPDGDIRGAVAARQLKAVNDVVVYGKLHQMLVQPLDNLPFYLVTFYDKGYIVPVNMRILIFALLFCFLTSMICLVLWLTITRKYSTEHQLVYCPMDAIAWIIPRPTEATYYVHAVFYIIAYIASLMGYAFLNRHYDISNFNILISLVVMPFNIILGLYTIRAAFTRPVREESWPELLRKRKDVWINVGTHLIISLLVYFFARNSFSITIGFLIYQLIINAILWIYAISNSDSRIFSFGAGRPFLWGYNRLATSLVIVLAVLPSVMFTWYAHNQELIQSIKRQQLHLATTIRDRSFVIREMKGVNDTSLPIPDFYLDSLRFSMGIYKIYGDSILYKPYIGKTEKRTESFEEFYFTIAEKVSNPYYKQQSYAALTDTAYDNSWYWKREGSRIHFSYYPPLPVLTTTDSVPGRRMLNIISELPPRFMFLGSFKGIVLLFVLVSLLLWGLHTWLKTNSHQIFLIRYIHGQTTAYEKNGLIAAYYSDKPVEFREKHTRLYNPSAYKNYTAGFDWKKLYQYEEAIVEDVHNGKGLYEYIWDKCSEKEKSLLYNIARDGLINYKNTKEIIALMKKGVLIEDCDRIKTFSPGFRAFILSVCTSDNPDMVRIQKRYLENSTWQLIRMPLLVLLVGIAAIIFFTQQHVFDKLLVLAGGISTLTTLVMRFVGGGAKEPANVGKG